MTKCYSRFIMIAVLSLMSTFPVLSADIKAIKDPKPNIIETEKQYIQLEKVKTIDADLGNGMYLFKPYSIALSNNSDDVYIYDNLQAKIFIMDPELITVKGSFGGKGVGPGELGSTGKGNQVFLQKGRNGKLYAYCNSPIVRKVIVFDCKGQYLREIKNLPSMLREPLVDASGNLYIMDIKDGMIHVLNENRDILFTLKGQEEHFDYLFSTPGPFYLQMTSINQGNSLLTALTIKSRLLLYFKPSSTMVIVENNEISKQFRLWPKNAFSSYLIKFAALKNKMETKKRYDVYLPLFKNLFVDEGDDRFFFLQLPGSENAENECLYQFNDNGQLEKVLYVKLKKISGEESSPIYFKAKKNDRYYAFEEDKLVLYKEIGQ